MPSTLTRTILALFCLTGLCLAQRRVSLERDLNCDGSNRNGRLASHCEIKEWTLPATGRVAVDGRQNGGITVKGWDRNEVLLRARIDTAAPTDQEARALVNQILIQTSGEIRAEGPRNDRDQHWSVSYEVLVPRQTDLSLKTTNGGLSIADVRGRSEFQAVNGGVHLRRLAGNVSGRTTNGGLSVELAGDRWDGDQLDVRTTNGGVSLAVPSNYSARLETGTVNGNIHVDFPVTVQGDIRRELSVVLGSGGPLVRAFTTNGGVSIKRL